MKTVAGFYLPELAPRLHTTVKLKQAILRSYAGEYRLDDRFTIKVTLAGDRLESIWLSQKLVMAPASETMFFEEDSDRSWRFVKGESGNVTSLVVSPEELTLRRLP